MGFIYKRHYSISSYLINTQININDHLLFDYSKLEGWGVDFIIAGDFIHNILNNFSSKEIHFFVLTEKGFHTLLYFFYKMTNYTTFSITKQNIDLNLNGYPYIIKLFNRINWSIYQCMESYYFNYKKCFFDGETIKISPDCIEMMNEKNIYLSFQGNYIYYKDILDAIEKGYKFKKEFIASTGIENIELEEIINEKKIYIGQNFHEINDNELLILKNFAKNYELNEKDCFNYIFTIHDSLETIIILLSLIYKYTPLYENICCCDFCEFEYEYEDYKKHEHNLEPLSFYSIIDFLQNDTE
jgi:hypothetical protein